MAETRVRVLQLVAGLDIGRGAGGAELFAVRLAQLLDRTRCDPALFVLWRQDTELEAQWLAQLAAANIPVYGLITPTGRLPYDLARVAAALWQAVQTFQPQVINSHSERGDLLNLGMKLLHPCHPRAVQTVHIDLQWSTQPLFGLLFNHFLAPLLFDQQVAISATVQTLLATRPLARWQQRQPVRLYNGIDASQFTRDLPRSSSPTQGQARSGRIGIVGRLAVQKGHADLLQAIAWVQQVLPVTLWIVGDGPLAAPLQQQVDALGLTAQVHFLGQRDDVDRLLPTFELLVSASLWEGFPTVILEAMAAGVPVVATDVSGSRELVQNGQTGLLVAPRQPEQLAAAIIALLTNPAAAQRMARAAHAHAQQYTLQATAHAYSALYPALVR